MNHQVNLVPGQDLQTGQERVPVAADVALKAKRATARKAGSTYAPDFLGLLEVRKRESPGGGEQHGTSMNKLYLILSNYSNIEIWKIYL